jgi:hypothetical protein
MWVKAVKAGGEPVEHMPMDRRQPGEPRSAWDVPFFGEGFVASADGATPLRARAPGAPTAASPERAGRRSGVGGRAFVAAVIVLALGAVLLSSHLLSGSSLLLGRGSHMYRPPPSREESRSPLGHPPPVAFPSGSYRFVRQQPGSSKPVTYDPCRPIHYVVNPAREPQGAGAAVRTAVAAVAAATGLRFIEDGATTEVYSTTRSLSQPVRYGRRWAPVLIDFTRSADNPLFSNGPIGVGGSSYVETADRHLTFVTGDVDIDSEAAARLVADPRRVPLSAIIEHELGHVVGLAHVNDMTQLMYPSGGHGVTSYGSGDLSGLAELGNGGCEPGL